MYEAKKCWLKCAFLTHPCKIISIIKRQDQPMKQLSFTTSKFAREPRQTRREEFPLEMDAVHQEYGNQS
jgi:hypothetical protein